MTNDTRSIPISRSDARPDEEREVAYVPPRLTVLGSLQELTLGSHRKQRTDGIFPGSLFS